MNTRVKVQFDNATRWVTLLLCYFVTLNMSAQDVIEFPDISYAGTPRTLILGGINVSGMATKTMP